MKLLSCAFRCSSSVLLLFAASIDLSCVHQPFPGKVEPVNYEKVSVLAPCLLKLSEKYFKSEKAMRGSLVVFNTVPHPTPFLQTNALMFFNENKRHVLAVMTKDAGFAHRNASRVTDRAQNYMLLLIEQKDLTNALQQWKSLPTWNPNAQTVIVFMDPMESVEAKDLKVRRIFEELLENGMVYANVIYQMSDDPLKMEVETWFPYYDKGCSKSVDNIYKIDECVVFDTVDKLTNITKKARNITEYNREKYPKIPTTFHNCSLEVSAFTFEPFVIGNSREVKSGLETLMLQTITEQMEMKLNFIILDDEVRTKKITADNETGIYANLIQKKSDVLVGGLYENPISRKLVSSSIPYFQDDVTWCVSKAGLAPTWLNVFIIFNISTWIGLLLTLVIVSISLLYFIRFEKKYRENFSWALIVTMAIVTGQYGHYWPVKSALRIFLASLFFFGLHINTAYHSYLINVLTNPRYASQISTVQAGINAGLEFQVGENIVEFFEKDDAVSQYLLLNHKICHDIDECFKVMTKDRTKAIAVSRSHALNNPFQLKANDDFYCFPISDDVVLYSTMMMFRRFHHLLPTINGKIRAILESGLGTKWKEENKMSTKQATTKAAGHGKHGGVQMIIRVEHVEGAFLVILIGLAIAFVVFLLELLTHWLVKTKPSHRILKVIEKFLCHA